MSLEVLYNYEKDRIRRPEDAVVCCLHNYMTVNGYKCIGNGETVPTGNIRKSDMLPNGWSDGGGVYNLMYQHSDAADATTYLLKVIGVDGMLLVHLLRTRDEKVVDMEIKTSDYVGQDFTTFDKAYNNLDGLEKKFKSDILAVFASKPSSTKSLIDSRHDDRRPPDNRVSPPDNRIPRPQVPSFGRQDWDPLRDPRSVGRCDLDPLCGGRGGGMVFDPFRPSDPRGIGGVYGPGGSAGLPPGAVIPGARFDPYRPPDPDAPPTRPHAGPDADHMPPPGFDDMFM